MIVATAQIELMIQDVSSLKEKRQVLSSLLGRLRARFHLSVAEVGYQDKWQRALVGVAAVSNDSRHAQAMLQSVLRFIENDNRVEVLRFDQEMTG